MTDMPVVPEAERAVLGAILRSAAIPSEVETLLSPDDFYDPHLGAIYAAALTLSAGGKPCDYVAVLDAIGPAGHRAMGGGVGLLELSESAPVGGLVYHAGIVAEHAERRRYITAAYKIAEAAREGTQQLGSLARSAVDAVPRLTAVDTDSNWDVLASILDPQKTQPGIMYGFPDLDEVLNPMTPGTLTTIAARSGVGKSTLALDISRHAALRLGRKVLYISIEMSKRQVLMRALSAEARIMFSTIRRHLPRDPQEEAREAVAAARIGDGPLVVVEQPTCSAADVRALVRREKPDLCIIDYFGRMQLPKADRHDISLSILARDIRNIGQTEGCHMVLLSQFNRKGDHRQDKRPEMGDLKDSSALENESDLVLLLHRPDKYDPDDRPGEVDVIVGKQRDGKADVAVTLAAQLHYSRFSSMAYQPTPSEPVVDITQPTRHGEYV